MRDFDYEVWQKKIIARGATHRKRGSKSKKCTLPSDHLTEAQKRQLNGKVYTMNKNKPMTWEYFQSIPQSLQQEYIRYLQEQFDARAANIAQMFDVTTAKFEYYCDKHELTFESKRGCITNEKRREWEKFLGINNDAPALDPETNETSKPVEFDTTSNATFARPAVKINHLKLDVTGDLFALAEYLKTFALEGEYRLIAELTKVEETL